MPSVNRWSLCIFLWVGFAGIGTAQADLLVAGQFSGQVLRYDDSGAFVGALSGSAPPLGIALGPDGAVYTSNSYVDHLSRFDLVTQSFLPFTTGGTLRNPHQIAFGGPTMDLYSTDLGGFGPLAAVNRFAGDTGAFIESIPLPTGAGASAGIAVDATGTLYISDRPSGTLFKYESGSLTTFASALPDIEGLTLGPDGKLYVGTGDTRVLRFSLDGTPFGAGGDVLDPTFINDARLNLAFSIEFDGAGRIYVASSRTDEVLRYTSDGGFSDTFISAGAGGLVFPTYMVFAPVPLPSTILLLLTGIIVPAVWGCRHTRSPDRRAIG